MVAEPPPAVDPGYLRRRDSLFAVGRSARRPTFAQFPARSSVPRARPVAPVLDTPAARRYRTVIRRGAARGPNFAGAFTVVLWGCGTECQQLAIVDARTGRVFVASFVTTAGVSFRRESRLLIANPPENTREAVSMGADPGRYFARYYAWTGRRLALLDSIPAAP